mmetsp:Transcript_54695/g.138112  ORF Transcript_54695/g.138112 Transcript_54695/m.138112 type:complete len:287 (+) Transcript_54695:97-957(+)
MLVPEEYRCCVCLSTPERALLTGCPHRVCESCADSGNLRACPVCRAELPEDRPLDESFARLVAAATITCDCGVSVPVLHAETHHCEQVRKRKRPEGNLPEIARGRKPPAAPNRSTFACPLCDERNLTSQGLLEHCERAHASNGRGSVSAVCPICLSMPWGDPSYVSRDFLSHLRLRHRCDYTVLTDFEADEEAMFRRAMRESLQSAGLEEEAAEDERILAQVLAQSAREAGVPAPSSSTADGDATDGAGDGSGSESSTSAGDATPSSAQANNSVAAAATAAASATA